MRVVTFPGYVTAGKHSMGRNRFPPGMDGRLGHAFACEELLYTMRGMDMLELAGEGWVPAYTRDDVADALHDAFGFRTDYEIVTNRQMGKVLTAAHSAKVRSTKR